ncbi:hypothetical protein CMUS01_07411 [Colletotrichum musicola]|uniref:Uncharacterized protein n=1 Tax=Colletotrichum musicola TaxID=2175873 RepID=A0A8H6KGM0_9PEZI|nr:hypothetical protein CMUS01_07411 [Colletotrichum musicola]
MSEGHFRTGPPIGFQDKLQALWRHTAVLARLRDPLPHFCAADDSHRWRCRASFFVNCWFSDRVGPDKVIDAFTSRFTEVFGTREGTKMRDRVYYSGRAWDTGIQGRHYRFSFELAHPLPAGVRSPYDAFSLGTAYERTIEPVDCRQEKEVLASKLSKFVHEWKDTAVLSFDRWPAGMLEQVGRE